MPVYACVHAKLLQSCPTLCGPMDHSPPDSSVHEILQARILECIAIPSSGEIFPTQGLNPRFARVSLEKLGEAKASRVQVMSPEQNKSRLHSGI